MLDINFIRENADKVQKGAQDKCFDVDIPRLLELDDRRRELIQENEAVRARRNEVASAIPKASNEERPALIAEGRELKDRLQELDETLNAVKEEYDKKLLLIPNVALDEVPIGKTDDDNVELRKYLEPTQFDFEPRDHEELGELLDIIDKKRAIKFAGARSYLLKGAGAMLEMAVMRLAMDLMVEAGFTPVIGPVMVNESAMTGSGFFPYGREDTYHLERDDKWLVGTSEVYLVNVHADEILELSDLPKLYSGYSPCFRREAGSAGADTRGIYRVHQFTKVEQVAIIPADKEKSREVHDMLMGNSERLMQMLELPHRVAAACTGEIGLGQVLKHELETWMPSRNRYSETHSCSSLYDYQARRAGIRYRDEDGTIKYAYTLNNTLAASPRILIPILENYQNEDGSVRIPKALQPYMYGMEVIEVPKK
ncbi:serine--tRNA ligase [Bradymonas sediminis]|uniref:Serine--tRNA ligase n=1 Tax=Bradymonas sediminis TaxID=1548548 RepID=A0A2Z4FJX7_9DELT|nr:serine--tRNA ligase [Bradymonas sediminis]AWV89145.1 serine--tRNA ligase [Bradymonas sediminis]TDP64389.1 seryl-tRNA synthetase [Bradymonas sediminis]